MRMHEVPNGQRISINIIPAVAIPIYHFIDTHTEYKHIKKANCSCGCQKYSSALNYT